MADKHKPAPPVAMAKELVKRGRGFVAGTVYLWGMTPTRPDDEYFRVVDSKAREDVLEIQFEDSKGLGGYLDGMPLTIWSPDGLEVRGDAIVIHSATRVRWGDIDVAPVTEGEVQIRRGASVTQRRASKDALLLSLCQGQAAWKK